MKVVTVEEMGQIEEVCAKIGLPSDILMENAGKAVAEQVRLRLGAIDQQHVLVMVGPGNNGGDGLVAARYLHDWGAKVSVYLLTQRPDNDPNLKLVRVRDIPCMDVTEDENLGKLSELLSSCSAVIDSIFGTGTGQNRHLEGIFQQALGMVSDIQSNRPELHTFALDVPSGFDADSGSADPACLYVDDTITLGFPKLGLFNASGAERAGQITVADIGIPSYLAEQISVELITDDWVASNLPERPFLANKGTFGRVLVVSGSNQYIGAAYLACMGAIRVGAGLVTLATPNRLKPVLATKLTETTYLPLTEAKPGIVSPGAAKQIQQELGNYDVLQIGCGVGQSRPVANFIKNVLLGPKRAQLPLVVDADALNILATIPNWWQKLHDDAILTPHPGEMSRLAGISANEVQSNRTGIARRMAGEWGKTVVLKGAYSVIATPDGECHISPMANPGLASAGTGDVLAGVIAGLRAQGLAAAEAAACGVYLHAEAGEVIRADIGDAGMIASDLLPVLPMVIQELKEGLESSYIEGE
ncbi:MAG: NAD(P)H-hydrate dehydratase [Dehalococcoidales bacterium]|nr:MAG: NAD(P)H-hydrate dehydratase [Dehalococcoidales bacterium]